jgi:serine/threonine protein kinase
LIIILNLFYYILVLHTFKCAHRDIKLLNILLNNKDFQLKIADFGLSEIYKQDSKGIYSVSGTLKYLNEELNK